MNKCEIIDLKPFILAFSPKTQKPMGFWSLVFGFFWVGFFVANPELSIKMNMLKFVKFSQPL